MEQPWRKHGECQGLNADVFFPATEEDAEEAQAICSRCAVQEACLEYALNRNEKDGVWGGATERDRRRILRRRRQSA